MSNDEKVREAGDPVSRRAFKKRPTRVSLLPSP